MRLKTIKSRMRLSGISKKQIKALHRVMIGCTDESTNPFEKNGLLWLEAVSLCLGCHPSQNKGR